MKNLYLFLYATLFTGIVSAQNFQKLSVKDLVKNTSLLTPQVYEAIAKHGVGEDGEIQLGVVEGMHLTTH